jgi:hypothetical protein
LSEPNESIVPEDAHKVKEEIIVCHRETQKNFLRLGSLFKECRDKQYWKVLGYDSFAAFIGDPEIALKRSTVANMIHIYELYAERLSIRIDELSRIGSRKLQIIAPVVETDPERWLAEAETSSKSDLINSVRAEQGKEPVVFKPAPKEGPTGDYLEYVRSSQCCVCGGVPSEAAHFPVSKGAGAGGEDVIPLCRRCHEEQHRRGKLTFFENYGHLIFRWMYDIIHARFQ